MGGFPAFLKDLRSKHQLSLQKAADKIGITKSHLWDMESGSSSNPCVKTLAGISKTYEVDLSIVSNLAAVALIGEGPISPIRIVPDKELEVWAEKRADDAGRLARELIHYRRLTHDDKGRVALERSLDFIESLTADPLLIGDDIEMTLDDVQAHARIELASILRMTREIEL